MSARRPGVRAPPPLGPLADGGNAVGPAARMRDRADGVVAYATGTMSPFHVVVM